MCAHSGDEEGSSRACVPCKEEEHRTHKKMVSRHESTHQSQSQMLHPPCFRCSKPVAAAAAAACTCKKERFNRQLLNNPFFSSSSSLRQEAATMKVQVLSDNIP